MDTSGKVGEVNKTKEQIMELRGQSVGRIRYMDIEIIKNHNKNDIDKNDSKPWGNSSSVTEKESVDGSNKESYIRKYSLENTANRI